MSNSSEIILKNIIRAALDAPEHINVEDLRQITYPKWDSLAQVGMISGVESEFGITLTSSEMERFTSYKSIQLILLDRNIL